MKRRFAGLSDRGIIRSVNQDSFHIDPTGRFFIVADGMGGHAGGQEASKIAAQTIQQYLNERWDSSDPSPMLLEKAFLAANQAIMKDQMDHPERSDMGTTAVAVIFRKDPHSRDGKSEATWCAHVGDSRLYRLRGHTLEQMTTDHTWVARAVKTGQLSPDDARTHPWRHVLSQCLGREDMGDIDIQALDVQSGDKLLLCSDGLTEELSDQIIASNLKSIRANEKAAQTLVDAAKDKGGRDNITVVIVAIESNQDG